MGKGVVPVCHWAFRVFVFARQVKQYPVMIGMHVYVCVYTLQLLNTTHP